MATLPGYETVWTETFDTGLGQLSRSWGHVWVHDGEATIASWAGDSFQPSGIMVPPTGTTAGNGFGLYSITAATDANEGPGAFACLWPGSDKWPGPELDLFEKQGPNSNANGYSTNHFKGADGGDAYQTHMFSDAGLSIDMSLPHTYAMDWQSDHLSLYIDQQLVYTQTDHVPQDAAHGGENEAFGAGTQPAWAAAQQNGDNVLHVYEMSYSVGPGQAVPAPPMGDLPAPVPVPAPPLVSEPAPGPAPAPEAPAASSHGEIDWAATSAAVAARFEATGQWGFLDDEVYVYKGAAPASPAPAGPAAPAPADPVEPATPADPVVRGNLTGGAGKDTLQLDHAFHFNVDGGAGKDTIGLGADHGDVAVIMTAGQIKGDLIVGFSHGAGDTLEFHGFGAGAEVQALGSGSFKVMDDLGHAEKFTLLGVNELHAGDYVFA